MVPPAMAGQVAAGTRFAGLAVASLFSRPPPPPPLRLQVKAYVVAASRQLEHQRSQVNEQGRA